MSVGGKVDLTKRVFLGVFIPRNFSDKEWLFDVLDKKLEEIEGIGTPCLGDNLVLEWCISRHRPIFLHPIKAGYNLIEAFETISKVADKICVIDNGCSEGVTKIIELCKEKGLDHRVLHCSSLVEQLNCANLKIEELEKKLASKKRAKKKGAEEAKDGE